VSGVQAGAAGGFGLVVGVDRVQGASRLGDHGAHVVVDDLRTLIS
jgi:beta-phosphoglucomutase-like phosphatase (HAD superfamily)